MLNTALTPFYDELRPAGYAGLMDLYEENYLRLRRLLPELSRFAEHTRVRADAALDLYVTILERGRYTTTLSLTYLFRTARGTAAEPALVIRLYHDARLAEALYEGDMPPCPRAILALKWRHNRFLHRWLLYCLRQGYQRQPLTQSA
jgi:hypothetical protein